MKKRPSASTVALASALAGLPMMAPSALVAQRPGIEKPIIPGPVMIKEATLNFATAFCCIKGRADQTIVGLNNGQPVYQNTRGEYYSVNMQNGDLQFLPPDAFAQFHDIAERSRSAQGPRMVKWHIVKYGGEVTIMGVDPAGHVINRNAQGTKFYLNPTTGDMVVVP